MSKEKDNQKKDYSKIEVKNNMEVDNNGEEVAEKVPVKRERPSQIVTKVPEKRKKGLMERLVVGFLGPEGLPGIGQYLNEEIIVPSIKNIIVEAVTSGINMAIFGDRGRPTGGNKYTSHYSPNRQVYRPETNYTAPSRTSRYTSAQPEPSRAPRMARYRGYEVDEYPIESRLEASKILDTLTEFADTYDYVSVADYYDMIGAPTQPIDHNFGWSYDIIIKASITPLRGGGYILQFPPVTEI